jgi:hypothetical protein
MNRIGICCMGILLLGIVAAEQAATAQTTAPVKGMASTVGLYVYPKTKQTATQQLTDEQQCYSNAKSQTGFNPNATTTATNTAKTTTPKTNDKSVQQGAMRGAMIARASGGSPAVGARRGALMAGMEGKRNQRAQTQQQTKTTAAQTAQQQSLDGFKRSMSSCLDARSYSVR